MPSMPKQKPGRSKQTYRTPRRLLRAVKRRLQIEDFAIDLAASPRNAVCERYYTKHEDALSRIRRWAVRAPDGWAWCNPPFGHLRPWVRKAWWESRRGAKIAMLVPAGVGSNWWRDFVHGKAMVLLLNGRITFVGQPTCYPKDCCLLLYTPVEVPRYDVWQWS